MCFVFIGQRYGNKYGSDYSVEVVGNVYEYEDGKHFQSFVLIYQTYELPKILNRTMPNFLLAT